MNETEKKAKRAENTKEFFCDVTGLGGSAGISYGAYLIYEPAAYIVGGLFLVGFAVLMGKK